MSTVMEQDIKARFRQAVAEGNVELAERLALEINSASSLDECWIANISERTWGPLNAWHYMGPVIVPGKKEGEDYSLYKVIPHSDHIDLGDNRTLPVFIPARDTANDICHHFNDDIGQDSFSGLFVIANGDLPTQAELSEARAKLENFYRRLVAVADLEWDRGTPGRINISDLHRAAGRYFGLKKPWLSDLRQTQECPMCMERIPAGAGICAHCGAVLDEDRAKKFGMVPTETPALPEPKVSHRRQRTVQPGA